MLYRSQINASIDAAIRQFELHGLRLPPFAYWSPQQWLEAGEEADEIRECMLGWDVTDFGCGDFANIGRTLFTLRNGRLGHPKYAKGYAEKFLLEPEGQRAPAHYHRSKREDIIHRGKSGVVVVLLTPSSDASGGLPVQVDGITRTLAPDEKIRLLPGQSVEIPPRTVHQFWAEEGQGITVSGEVSTVCDDWNDNCFLGAASRFPEIVEDEPRRHYLCHEYPGVPEASDGAPYSQAAAQVVYR